MKRLSTVRFGTTNWNGIRVKVRNSVGCNLARLSGDRSWDAVWDHVEITLWAMVGTKTWSMVGVRIAVRSRTSINA